MNKVWVPRDGNYSKRVSRIEKRPSCLDEARRNVAVWEYLGKCPFGVRDHGNAKQNPLEFVQTNPSALYKVAEAVKTK